MTHFKKIFLTLLFILSNLSMAQAEPEPNTVTLPLQTFIKLWNEAKDKTWERLVPYAYGSTSLEATGKVEKEDMVFSFTMKTTLEVFGTEKVSVPFLDASLNLESVSVDGKPATWVINENNLEVIMSGNGQHNVEAKFLVKIPEARWPRVLEFPLVSTPQTKISVVVPDKNIQAFMEPGVIVATKDQSVGSEVSGVLPATNKVSIKWLSQNAETKDIPLKMGATVYQYVSLEEGGATGNTIVDFRILQGKSNYFIVSVPDTIDILSVTSTLKENPISQWFIEKEGGQKKIHIYSNYQATEHFSAELAFEHTESSSQFSFTLPNITPQNVERYESYQASGSSTQVLLTEEKAENVDRLDVRFIPNEISRFSKNDALYFYKITSKKSFVSFLVKNQDKVPLANTVIEKMTTDSILTEKGTIMHKTTLVVKNNQAQFIPVKLPAGAKLLSVFLNGKEVEPALSDKNILIPIIKSPTGFSLEMAFLTKIKSFGSVGIKDLELPTTPVSISQLIWNVHTPETYQMIHFGGNLDNPQWTKSGFEKLFDLISQNDWIIPTAQAGGDFPYQYNEKGLKSRFKKEDSSQYSTPSYSNANQVQVEIPVLGKTYTFRTQLVRDFTPRVSLYYISHPIKRVVEFLVTLLTLALSFWTLAMVLEKKSLPLKYQPWKNYFLFLGASLAALSLFVFFSFGVGQHLFTSISLSLAFFALWQNRKMAIGFHARTKSLLKYLPEVFLFFILLFYWSWVTSFLFTYHYNSFYNVVYTFLACVVIGGQFIFDRGSLLVQKKWAIKKGTTLLLLVILASGFQAQAKEKISAGPDTSYSSDLSYLTGEITLPWSFLQSLFEKVEQKENEGTPDYSFGNVQIKGNVESKFVHLNLALPVNVFGKNSFGESVFVPLFRSSVAISKISLNGKTLSLISYIDEDNIEKVGFETNENLSGVIEMEIFLPIEEKGGVGEFEMKAPLLWGAMLELNLNSSIQTIHFKNAALEEKNGSFIKVLLGNSNELSGEVASFQRATETAESKQNRVQKIYSETYTLATLEESVVSFYSSIRYRFLNTETKTIKFRLPKDVVVNDIVGDDIESWDAKEDQNGKLYEVKILYPLNALYDLSIKYEKNRTKGKTESWALPNLEVLDVARNVGYVGFEMPSQGELRVGKMDKARLIDTRELPNIIQKDTTSPVVYALRYVEQPFKAEFSIENYKTVEMEAAIADRMDLTHVISPQGKVMSSARLLVRNSQQQFLKLTLPKGSKMVSSFLDNNPVKPSYADDGAILMPLKRQSSESFAVEIIYEEKDMRLNSFLGTNKFQSPIVDIPVSMVFSNIYYPTKYAFKLSGGDFSINQVSTYLAWSGNTYQDQVSTSNGYIDIEDNESGGGSPPPTEEPANSPQTIVTENKPRSSQIAGTLPLKIELPKNGKSLQAQAFYIPKNTDLTFKFCYNKAGFSNFSEFILTLALFAAGFFTLFFSSWSTKTKTAFIAGIVILYALSPFLWEQALFYLGLGYIAQKVGTPVYTKTRKFLARD